MEGRQSGRVEAESEQAMVILMPTTAPDDWRQFLAQPELHWETGYSARTMAYAWEASGGVPPEVRGLLAQALGPITPLVVIPERKTPLPGGRRESQSDAFLLARASTGLIACTIEGKVSEPFGPTVAQQMVGASAGKKERLDYLCQRLGLKACPDHVHYQLLHRSVAALIEADLFAAQHAAMIVHSFSPERRWFDAFARFVELLGGPTAEVGKAVVVPVEGRELVLGWACGEPRFREM